MVIRKQPIMSWLLNKSYVLKQNDIGIPQTNKQEYYVYLCDGLNFLSEIREKSPNWGLPEMLMLTFEAAMVKSAKSFFDEDHQLFQKFSDSDTCGILLHRTLGTVVYGFGGNILYVWLFRDQNGVSILYNYFYFESTIRNTRNIYCNPTILEGLGIEDAEFYSKVGNLLICYLAVKNYAEVETIFVPDKTIKKIEDSSAEHKEKIRNESGQEVLVMDSRWFVQVVNDNDIPVRGFYRMQNKKNSEGEWVKERIYIEPFIRHGYYRSAKIEIENGKDK